jgi:hypothetical protein
MSFVLRDRSDGGSGGTIPVLTFGCCDRAAETARQPIAARMACDIQVWEGGCRWVHVAR